MGQLLGYIKNIGFFLILMSVVSNVMPDNSYKKYCRLFCGLILVVLVINPFYKFLNYDGGIGDIFVSNTYKSELLELEKQLEVQQQFLDDKAVEHYEGIIRNELDGMAIEAGLYLLEVSVEFRETEEGDDLSLDELTLYVTDEKSVYDEHIKNASEKDEYEDTDNNDEIKIEKIEVDIGSSTDNENDNDAMEDENMEGEATNPRAIQLIRSVADHLEINENQIRVIIR